MPDGSPIGTLRLFARTEEERSQTIMEFFQEWLGEIGIESEVSVMESNQLTDVILEGNFDAFHWGWYVEPDPDSILSVFLCDARGGSSDSWYCNEEFDELYASQNAEVDDEKRIETIKQMQEIIFRDSPYLVTAYTTTARRVRTDRFACFQPQPDPGRGPAGAVRRVQLHVAPSGRRGRRLRRHRVRGRGVVRRRVATTTTAAAPC